MLRLWRFWKMLNSRHYEPLTVILSEAEGSLARTLRSFGFAQDDKEGASVGQRG
jgi:hypothetical protein